MTSSTPRRPGPAALAGLAVWIGLLALISYWMAGASLRWLPVQASNAAPLVDGLFSFETGVGTFVFLGVISVMGWVMLVHRAEKYDESDAEPIEGNTRLEVIWTAIPLVLVMAIAWYAIQINTELGVLGPMEHIHLRSPQEQQGGYPGDRLPAEQVEVLARQWSWEFRYPGDHVSSTELHLELDRPVTFRLVSEDVLHGFFIPAFRLKQDVIPGRAIDFSLTPTRVGRYRLRDSQFSGTWFAANQADVVVETAEDHGLWLKQAAAAPLQRGLSVAADEYAERQTNPRGGWPTVVPAPPPQVNAPGSSSLPHDA
ncbi:MULTISPECIES: cytochrome c oxidase subunit II [unclassified Cyanobium]|uniref:cytochrome c oxidase subunit II n=1 Tax=unclassified Cyanobium TaxID=2627006 RepID=UPI0020CBB970|nr:MULTISPECIES: cytochrome c oxidase subunit II [unclassified Cyanobium]MCP9833935.1 cytochrome c oxidase subunit II [Cyanobium sp. La Preciosa 7G6]MCP9936698.1 cytochrome c oxidase subunit II [Cyanobium sp. Aljojuca 7A6]